MDGLLPCLASRLRAIFGIAALAAACIAAPASADDRDSVKLDPFARAEAGIVSAQTSTQNDEFIVNGDGLTLRGAAGFHLGDKNTRLTVEADHLRVERLGNRRSNANRDRFTLSLEQRLNADFSVQLRARRFDDLSTAEFNDTDELQLSARLEYEPQRAHRVQIRAGWHAREYDDGDGPGGDGPAGTSSTGEGPRVSAQYRHRLDRYHYVTFDLRAEEINSDNARRSYTRQSAGASYTRPITDDMRLRPAIYIQHTRFDGRFTGTQRRDDTLIVPELELQYWPGKWRVEAEAKYIFAQSNDPLRDREGYRASVTIGYVF